MANTWDTLAKTRYKLDFPVYASQIFGCIDRWSRDRNLLQLDMGGGINPRPGFKSVDLEGGDVTADLTKPWPFPDNSVGCLNFSDTLEHLPDPLHIFSEAWRVLADGGYMMTYTPAWDCDGFWSDPTHVRGYSLRSFKYYTQKELSRFLPSKYQHIRFRPMWEFKTKVNDELTYLTWHAIALKGGESETESRGDRAAFPA